MTLFPVFYVFYQLFSLIILFNSSNKIANSFFYYIMHKNTEIEELYAQRNKARFRFFFIIRN